MNVRQLVRSLQRYPEDYEVVMSKDAEGNSYSPLSELGTAVYVPDSEWSGKIYVGRNLTSYLSDAGYSEEDTYDGENGQDCIVLWPTN